MGNPAGADEKHKRSGFVHAEGGKIIGTDGRELMIQGISLGNCAYVNPSLPPENHHSGDSYGDIAAMGFNSVRFYLNYGLFEDDSAPYEYKSTGIEWLEKNVSQAKKHGLGVIFNMHYPQGGYQSGGDGTALWTDKSNRDRLAALWRYIAGHFAEEPAVWGYGIVNEPVVPMLGSKEASAEQYFSLARRLTAEIRSVSPYQAVFAERLCAVKNMEDGTSDWEMFTEAESFPVIDDDNVIYEFHSYVPHRFTHQNAEWSGNKGVFMNYPSDEAAEIIYENYWTGCERAAEISADGEWAYCESAPVSADSGSNAACAALNVVAAGENGAAYFDGVTVTEISPSGEKRVKYAYDLSRQAGEFRPWSSDGTGVLEVVIGEGRGKNGCVRISGNKADFTASAAGFELREGYKYVISGYVKSVGCSASIRLDLALAREINGADISCLDREIKRYAALSAERGIPVYLGEFGVIRYGFEENRGGEAWVADMIDVCRRYGVGFNYHTYHEYAFGLYMNDQNEPPAELNAALAEVFAKKLGNIK